MGKHFLIKNQMGKIKNQMGKILHALYRPILLPHLVFFVNIYMQLIPHSHENCIRRMNNIALVLFTILGIKRQKVFLCTTSISHLFCYFRQWTQVSSPSAIIIIELKNRYNSHILITSPSVLFFQDNVYLNSTIPSPPNSPSLFSHNWLKI